MNDRSSTPPSRADAWRNAAFMALVVAAALLVIIKLMTGIAFMLALVVAITVFMVSLGFIMRLTPRDR